MALVIPGTTKGKKMSFAEAVKAVINHRRCCKVKAVAFLSNLPKIKKDRQLSDLQGFLDSLVNILQVLCNLRDKDLRTKSALSRLALKQLRQENGSLGELQPAMNGRKSTMYVDGKETVEEETDSVKSWDDLVSFKSSGGYNEDNFQTRKKLPLWQLITLESADTTTQWSSGKRRTAEKNYTHHLMDRISAGWNLVQARQAYDYKHSIRNIERMELVRHRIQLAMLDKRISCVEYYRKMVTKAVPTTIVIDLNEKEIEKMSWCDNITDQCQNFMDSDPNVRFPQMEKLKKFSRLDFTKVNFVKAKLCLYVLSLPANEILAIPTQRALLFTLSSILQLSRSILKQWMDTRSLPLYDIDPLAK